MDDLSKTSDRPKLETLSYKPPVCALPNKNSGVLANPEQPTNTPSAALGFNSHVIKPEIGVRKNKVADQHPEQPNQNLMIIAEIEGLMSQMNEKLENLPISNPIWYGIRAKALEKIDLFQKTTLFELRKAFE